MSPGGPLTRRDFDEVMRRASELAAEESGDPHGGFSEAEIVRIGHEVGLPEHHVRRALSEFRSRGHGAEGGQGKGLRHLLAPGDVRAGRTIDRPRARIRSELDEFMVGGQLLQRVRRKDDLLQYRPAVDWASRVARSASSTSRQHYVASSRLVEIRLEEVDGESTLVEIQVDPGIVANYRGGAIVGGGIAGVAVGVAIGVGMAAVFPVAVAMSGGVIAGVVAALLVAAVVGRGLRRRMGEVQAEVEGVLDGLESENGLEPPPPAWRRWVRRHFHGVAREMMGTDQGDTNWKSRK